MDAHAHNLQELDAVEAPLELLHKLIVEVKINAILGFLVVKELKDQDRELVPKPT